MPELPMPELLCGLLAARGVGAARAGDVAGQAGVVRVVLRDPAGLGLLAALGQIGEVDRAFEIGLLVRLAGTHVSLLRLPALIPAHRPAMRCKHCKRLHSVFTAFYPRRG